MSSRFFGYGGNLCRYSLKPALLLLVCVLSSGCGYHFAGGENSGVSLRGKTIAVPMFANRALRPNLETVLTGALRDEAAWRSGGKRADAETADLIVTGTVLSYASTPVSYTADDRIREYRAAITAEASLRNRLTGEVLWKGTQTLSQEYPVVDFPLANRPLAERVAPENRIALQQNSEETAVREICRKLAQDFYEKMNDGF